MPTRDLTYRVLGKDESGSSTFSKVADSAEESGSRISGVFSKLGDTIGGEVGELVNKASEGWNKISEGGTSTFTKLSVGGGVVAGIGVAMQAFASKGEAAESQLKAAVDATGDSWEDYEGRVDAAISTQEKYGHTAPETENALQTLTSATGSLSTALDDMQVTEDLAAAKHISLGDAANLVAKIYAGSTKTLKMYGITVKENADGTKDYAGAVRDLGTALSGQGDASVDNFAGKVDALKAKIEDWADKIAGVAGGPLTALGTGLAIVEPALQIFALRAEKAAVKTAELAEKQVIAAAAADTEAAATTGLAVASEASSFAMGPLGIAAGVAGAAILAFGLANINSSDATEQSVQSTQDLTQAFEASKGAIDDNVRAKVANALIDSKAAADAGSFGVSLKTLTDAVLGNADAQKQALAAADKVGEKKYLQAILSGQAKGWKDARDAALRYLDTVNETGTATDTAAAAEAKATAQSKTLADALAQAAEASDTFSNALKKLNGDAVDAEEGLLRFKDSLDGVGQSAKDNGRSLDINSAAGRKNEQTILDAIAAAQKHATAVAQQTNSVDQATAAYGQDEAALRKAAIAAGFNATQVDALIKKYGSVPKDIATTISVDASKAFASIDAFSGKLQYVHQLLEEGDVGDYLKLAGQLDIGKTGRGTAGLASGGYLQDGVWTQVGEHGPELVSPDGRVFPTGQSQQMLRDSAPSGGGGITNHFTINMPTVIQQDPTTIRALISTLETAVNTYGFRIKGITH